MMDAFFLEFPCAHAFIDDILVISKSSRIEHIALVEKNLKKIVEENMTLKLEKCKFEICEN